MPSDLFNNSFDSKNKFGLLADGFSKNIYSKYDLISNKVNRIMEVSFGIVHDLYKKWKNMDETHRIAILGKPIDEIDDLDPIGLYNRMCITKTAKEKLQNDKNPEFEKYKNSFSNFVRILVSKSSNSDIGQLIDNDNTKDDNEFLTTISLLRHELNNSDYDDSLLKFDICATHNEFPISKGCTYHTSSFPALAFKVVPSLKNVFKFTTDSTLDHTIPEVSYTVKLDINRLIHAIIDIYDPSLLTAAMGEDDRDVYIRNGVVKFKNCPEIFTRKIILEIYDNYFNIYSNWEQFIKRFKDGSDKIYNDPLVQNIITKLNHYNMITPNVQNNIFDSTSNGVVNDIEHVDFNRFDDFENSLYDISFSTNEENLFMALFIKTFKIFFSTAVAYIIEPRMVNNISSIALTSYYKEFFAKYDTNALLSRSTIISDYNTRDFFQTIIKETNCSPCKPYHEKMSNGENAYFMFCKQRRNIWIETTVSIMSTLKMLKSINTIYENKDIAKQKNLNRTAIILFKTFRSCIDTLRTLSNMEFTDWSDFSQYISSQDDNIIRKKIKYIQELKRKISGNATLFSGALNNKSEYDTISFNTCKLREIYGTIFENFKRFSFMILDQNAFKDADYPFD